MPSLCAVYFTLGHTLPPAKFWQPELSPAFLEFLRAGPFVGDRITEVCCGEGGCSTVAFGTRTQLSTAQG